MNFIPHGLKEKLPVPQKALYYILLQVQLPGKPRMAAENLVRGRQLRPGLRLGPGEPA